jgi:uncharacterized membrane protein YiaA
MLASRRGWIAMTIVVLAIWLVGTWVTKFSLEEMALYTPIAVLALGALAAIILLWVKIVTESLRRRREP